MSERLHDVIEAQQFSRPWIEQELFPQVKDMEVVARQGGSNLLVGKRIYNLFYEPSTRTRTSFEVAIDMLGGKFFGTDDASKFSSAIKGESLEDSVRILQGYHFNGITLRYNEEGGAARAAAVAEIPIINAGDGSGQHPTQALLDVYTINKELKHIDGVKVAMVGDLTYGRTTHSLAYLLAKFDDVSIDFVSPRILKMRPEITEYLGRHNVPYTEDRSLDEVLPEVDVVYMTRAQTERFKQGERYDGDKRSYRIDLEALNKLQKHAIVMHPLPRNDELPPEVDVDNRSAIFRQAQNGLYVRMALLSMLLK